MKRSGQPCFPNKRIAFKDILQYLASGMTEAEVMSDFNLSRGEMCVMYAYTAELTAVAWADFRITKIDFPQEGSPRCEIELSKINV